MKSFLVSFFFLGVWVSCCEADDHEQHIKRLAAGTSNERIVKSLRTLEAAGTTAYPALIANLTNRTPAEPRYFQRDTGEVTIEGNMRVHLPTIGDVCFGILQGQIEGNWPKGFRRYYVLSPRTARTWLNANRELTLQQLRQVSRETSLRRAEADLSKGPSDELLKKTVTFLRNELVSIKAIR